MYRFSRSLRPVFLFLFLPVVMCSIAHAAEKIPAKTTTSQANQHQSTQTYLWGVESDTDAAWATSSTVWVYPIHQEQSLVDGIERKSLVSVMHQAGMTPQGRVIQGNTVKNTGLLLAVADTSEIDPLVGSIWWIGNDGTSCRMAEHISVAEAPIVADQDLYVLQTHENDTVWSIYRLRDALQNPCDPAKPSSRTNPSTKIRTPYAVEHVATHKALWLSPIPWITSNTATNARINTTRNRNIQATQQEQRALFLKIDGKQKSIVMVDANSTKIIDENQNSNQSINKNKNIYQAHVVGDTLETAKIIFESVDRDSKSASIDRIDLAKKNMDRMYMHIEAGLSPRSDGNWLVWSSGKKDNSVWICPIPACDEEKQRERWKPATWGNTLRNGIAHPLAVGVVEQTDTKIKNPFVVVWIDQGPQKTKKIAILYGDHDDQQPTYHLLWPTTDAHFAGSALDVYGVTYVAE